MLTVLAILQTEPIQPERMSPVAAVVIGGGLCVVFAAIAFFVAQKGWLRFDTEPTDIGINEHVAIVRQGVLLLAGGMAGLALLIVFQSVFQFFIAVVGMNEQVQPHIAGIGAYACAVVGVVLICAAARTTRWDVVLWGNSPRLSALRGVLCFLLFLPVLLGVGMLAPSLWELVTRQEPSQLAHESLIEMEKQGFNAVSLMILVTAGFFAPVFEETLFRGMVQDGFARIAGSGRVQTWIAIVLTSVVFTTMHISAVGTSYYALAMIFMLSIGCGVTFARRRCVLDSIVVHMLFNMLSLWSTMLLMWSGQGTPAP